MTLIPAGCSDIDVRGSDRVEMTSCITEANIKTDQRSVKRYARRKGHVATRNNLPQADGVACSQEKEKKNPISTSARFYIYTFSRSF